MIHWGRFYLFIMGFKVEIIFHNAMIQYAVIAEVHFTEQRLIQLRQ